MRAIWKMTTPEVFMYIQRSNEPVYKQEIDNKLREIRGEDQTRKR